jgi:hypothetical protein
MIRLTNWDRLAIWNMDKGIVPADRSGTRLRIHTPDDLRRMPTLYLKFRHTVHFFQ